jgi:hypothetical protein
MVGQTATVTNLQMTGTPQPTARITWLSCTAQTSGCVTRAAGDSYVLREPDVGRYVRATVDAINGDPAGPRLLRPGLDHDLRGQPGLRGSRPGRPATEASRGARGTARHRGRCSVEHGGRRIGWSARSLRAVPRQRVTAFDLRPANGTSAVRVRAGRTSKVFAILCLEATCDVTVNRELRLRSARQRMGLVASSSPGGVWARAASLHVAVRTGARRDRPSRPR